MLQTLLSNYKLENTFDFDDLELLFQCILTKILYMKKNAMKGKK